MEPQPEHVRHRAALADIQHKDTLEHLGQISQVEGVVRFGRCREKLRADRIVHLYVVSER